MQESTRKKRLARKRWDMQRDEESKQEYKEMRREAKKEVAKAKNKAYDELYDGLDTQEGERTLARQRHRVGNDIPQIRTIREEGKRLSINMEK